MSRAESNQTIEPLLTVHTCRALGEREKALAGPARFRAGLARTEATSGATPS